MLPNRFRKEEGALQSPEILLLLPFWYMYIYIYTEAQRLQCQYLTRLYFVFLSIVADWLKLSETSNIKGSYNVM